MKDALLGVVDNFHGKRIAVFGDVMLDVFIYGTADRISPEAPVPVVDVKYIQNLPGGAANTANNIKSLGAEPILFGVVGDDEYAKKLYAELQHIGISTDYLIIDKDRPTTAKNRIVVSKHQTGRFDFESGGDISKSVESRVLKIAENEIKNSDGVILSDYKKGYLTYTLCDGLIKLCKKYNKPVVIDPKDNFRKYHGANIITPNLKEFTQFSGIEDVYDRDSVKKSIESNGLDALLITMGEHGMMLYEKDKATEIKSIKSGREVFDVTGAGDTVIATFTLALACGASMEQAAKLSNYAAGIVVGKFGTATTTIDELKMELGGYNE